MTLKDCLGLNISLNKNVYQNARASICQNINHKSDQNVTQKQDKICLSKYEPNKNYSSPKYIKFFSSEEKKVKIHQQTLLSDIFNTLLQVKICTQFRSKCSLKLGQKRVSQPRPPLSGHDGIFSIPLLYYVDFENEHVGRIKNLDFHCRKIGYITP